MKAPALLPLPTCRAVAIIAACLPLTLPAQEKPTPPETSAPTAAPAIPSSFSYEVVSIKPIKIEPGMSFAGGGTTLDGFSAQVVDLQSLLFDAFPILTNDQLVGLPQGSGLDHYSVEAKMDEETAAALKKLPFDQQQEIRRSMMLQVLVDRFKLKYHKETHELPIYNLMVAKNGPKFKETPAGKENNWSMGWDEISGDNIEMKQLPGMFSGYARRPVVDKTGLTGKYSFSLKWNPVAYEGAPDWFANQYPQFKDRPDLFIALEQQLGLKLEPAKGPVDVYVIDHIEKPSEN